MAIILGTNRAAKLYPQIRLLNEDRSHKPCVFLSHKSEDKAQCRKIAQYLSVAGIDYYLDELDDNLQTAAREEDPKAVTDCLKKGLRESTHMLVVVSAITLHSPWIPFEVGFGHAAIVDQPGFSKIELAVLTLKDAATLTLPDFLQTSYLMRGTKSLNIYIGQLTGLRESLLQAETRVFSHNQVGHPLDETLDWSL